MYAPEHMYIFCSKMHINSLRIKNGCTRSCVIRYQVKAGGTLKYGNEIFNTRLVQSWTVLFFKVGAD